MLLPVHDCLRGRLGNFLGLAQSRFGLFQLFPQQVDLAGPLVKLLAFFELAVQRFHDQQLSMSYQHRGNFEVALAAFGIHIGAKTGADAARFRLRPEILGLGKKAFEKR